LRPINTWIETYKQKEHRYVVVQVFGLSLFRCVLVSFDVCWSLLKCVGLFGKSTGMSLYRFLVWVSYVYVYEAHWCDQKLILCTHVVYVVVQVFDLSLFRCLLVSFDVCWSFLKHVGLFWCIYGESRYGVALASRIDKIIGLFCKRALLKRRYSAKETYNFIDSTGRSHPICLCTGLWSESLQLFVGLFSCVLVSFDVCWSFLKCVGLFWCLYGESRFVSLYRSLVLVAFDVCWSL